MYETFAHTADIGLRVEAASRDALFAEAARGLLSLIVENPESVRPVREVPLRIAGADPAYLLFDWLNELLYTFETSGLLLAEFDVAVNTRGLEATARGEPVDRARHRLDHEVKAITYHGLAVREEDGRWEATVIVDV